MQRLPDHDHEPGISFVEKVWAQPAEHSPARFESRISDKTSLRAEAVHRNFYNTYDISFYSFNEKLKELYISLKRKRVRKDSYVCYFGSPFFDTVSITSQNRSSSFNVV